MITRSKELIDYLPEFFGGMIVQLIHDGARWGVTWKSRPVGDYNGKGDQVDRAMARISDYYDQYKYGKQDFPWVKVACEALIGWVRFNYPNYAEEQIEVDDGHDDATSSDK